MTTAPERPALTAGDPSSEIAAASLAAQGHSIATIAARFSPPLSVEQARSAVTRGHHRASARSAPRPSQPAPAATPQPQEDGIEQLLAWAETDGSQRAATLAARTRGQLTELRTLKSNAAFTEDARRKVAAAERALADAKAELRNLGGSGLGGGGIGVPSKVIREWAIANGHDVSAIGVIPNRILDAYAAAHPKIGEA